MALILSIETSTDVCSVALHLDSILIGYQRYDLAKSHSSLLASLIKEVMDNADLKITDLNAVAVSAGPGSYTGLRIGVSLVKGIAYSQSIPIIGLDSLDVMYASFSKFQKPDEYAMPMIDARRMEVYCQLREANGGYVIKSKPLIIESNSLDDYIDMKIIVFGNGAEKTLSILGGANVRFVPNIVPEAINMGVLAYKKYNSHMFEDTAYFEPFYLKEYRTIPPKQKL